MAITFPRDMPDPPLVRPAPFKLQRMQIRRMTRAGLAAAADIGPPLWAVDMQTVPLTEAQAGEWIGIIDSLRGGIENIKLWPPMRRFPLVYQSGWGTLQIAGGGGAFTGQAALDAVGANNDTVTLSGLPDGFQLVAGDFLAFTYDTDKRALHKVVESAVANASGVGTWTVEPFVRPGWVATTAVDLEKPYCLMKIDPDSVSDPININRSTVLSFKALQTLS